MLVGESQYSLAAVGFWRLGDGRRDISADGSTTSQSRTAAGIAVFAFIIAVTRLDDRRGRPEPLFIVCVPGEDRTQPAVQQQVYFWPLLLASQFDQTEAGAVPADATKESHPKERGQFKVCALAVQYGMGADSLAAGLDEPTATGRWLLEVYRQTYPRFWRWSQAAVDHAMLYGWLQTVFGWRIHVGPNVNPRMLANFPMQANGAENVASGLLHGHRTRDMRLCPST